MDDEKIIELYFRRDETALTETAEKYGDHCHNVAYAILQSNEDSDECVNDTWLKAWNAIPPARPRRLGVFLAKITRNLAFDRYKARSAEKRGGGETALILDELAECIPGSAGAETVLLEKELVSSVNRFLRKLPPRDSGLFVRRYFFAESIPAIAGRYGISENNAAVILSRTRRKLKEHLKKEGYTL